MSFQPRKTKSSHMIQYYRKQSDKKMISTIIKMKSSLYHIFSQQKNTKKASINKSKRQMDLQLKKQEINTNNRRMVYRIKQIREKADRMKVKKEDDSLVMKRLLETRNSFRIRAREEQMMKTKYENQKFLKRLLNAKSQYNLTITEATEVAQDGRKRRSSNGFSRLLSNIYTHPSPKNSSTKSNIRLIGERQRQIKSVMKIYDQQEQEQAIQKQLKIARTTKNVNIPKKLSQINLKKRAKTQSLEQSLIILKKKYNNPQKKLSYLAEPNQNLFLNLNLLKYEPVGLNRRKNNNM